MLVRVVILAVAIAAATAGEAPAQTAEAISLRPQPLADALQDLSRRARVNILFAPAAVAGLTSPAVREARSVEDALRRILARTGLDVVRDGAGGYVVRPRRRATATAPDRPAEPPASPPIPAVPPLPLPAPDVARDIVVTALRRGDEALQSAPAAITAIPPDRLVRAGANSVAALVPLVPGLQVAPVRTTALTFIRGVGTTLTSPNADPAIAVHINGAYVPMEMTGVGFFDVQRIEVLPGPQGTLYGRNATGGVIAIVTRHPGASLAADGFAETGSYGRVQVQAGVDVPLASGLAIRAAATRIRHDGYDSNGGDDQRTASARLTTHWTPDAATHATGIVTITQDRGIGPFNFNVPAFYGPYRRQDFDPRQLGFFVDYRAVLASLEVGRDLGHGLRLTYVGGFDHLRQATRTAAWSGYPPAILDAAQRNRTVTEELRLHGEGKAMKAIAGLFAIHTDADYVSATDDGAAPVGTANAIGPFVAKTRGWAAFGQATYTVARGLRATAGLRHSVTHKTLRGENDTTTLDRDTGTRSTILFPYAGAARLARLDWRIAAEADLSATSLLYAGIATGFTPGGLSAAPATIGALPAATFGPTRLVAHSAGIKTRWFGTALTLNAEAFHYDYRDYQVSQRNLATGQNIVYTADRAGVLGLQLDVLARPTPNDEFTLSLSLQHARARVLVTPAGTFDGYQLPFAPDATLHAAYRRSVALPGGGRIEGHVNGEWTASRWGTYTHAPGTFVRPSHSLDATLTYRPPTDRYTLSLWARNLTDTIIPTQVTAAPPPVGPGQQFLRAPRTLGARLGWQF